MDDNIVVGHRFFLLDVVLVYLHLGVYDGLFQAPN